MKVKFLNLDRAFEAIRAAVLTAVETVIARNEFIGGESLAKFEAAFGKWLGEGMHAVGCGNGTDAIRIAVQALGIPRGTRAILPAMTFISTAEGVLDAGLEVDLVDVEEGTWLIDTKQAEAAIAPSTSLLVPVHLYGQMAPMDKLRAIADKRQLRVLEDAAQAHGAKWNGHSAGYYGDIATFSFFPGKNLGAFGDAGAIATRNADLAKTCYAIGKHGGSKKYEHLIPGTNSRLDSLQAAVLTTKLEHLGQWNESRFKWASQYQSELAGVSQLGLPKIQDSAKSAFHLFVITVPDREALGKFLHAKGIDTGVHYPLALHQLPVFQNRSFSKGRFPNAERIARHGLSLPLCPFMTANEVRYVSDSIKEFFTK